MNATTGFLALACLILGVAFRIFAILPRKRRPQESKLDPLRTCSLAVFLGSGGHTGEAILLLSSLNFDRYTPRKYIVSEGDAFSAQKAVELESQKVQSADPQYTIYTFPRARRVHQSLLSTPPTFFRSLLHALLVVCVRPAIQGRAFSDVLILNGPGTCVSIWAAAYLSRFLGLPSPRVIYIESFARVKSLSLSGKILRPFVDRFIVQWPDILDDGGRGEFVGWLI